jgi:trk system potassium uptake protein TrkA
MHTVFSAGNGEVEIYEFAIPEAWNGRTFGELVTVGNCVPISLTRDGTAHLPKNDMDLKENDILLVGATFDGIEALRKQLSNPMEK